MKPPLPQPFGLLGSLLKGGYATHPFGGEKPAGNEKFNFTSFKQTKKIVQINLDNLSEDELKTRSIQIGDYSNKKLNFSEQFKALPVVRRDAIEDTLSSRTIFAHIADSLTKKYTNVFENYVAAYDCAQKTNEEEVAKPVPEFAPLNMAAFRPKRGQKIPTVTIQCTSSKPPVDQKEDGALDAEDSSDEVPVDYNVIAAHSSVVKTMIESGMHETQSKEIILKAEAPVSTVDKLVQFMYERKPIKFASDQEAYDIYQFGDKYLIDDLKSQALPMTKKYSLNFCKPESLTSPEAFKVALGAKLEAEEDVELVPFYKATVAKVDNAYDKYLKLHFPVREALVAPAQAPAVEESKQD